MTDKDQHILLNVKSLLNHLEYFVRDEDKKLLDDYHTLCRKYCSWGGKNVKKPKSKNSKKI